ncbi:hypothetical protein ACQFZT_004402 [Providencia stuartii]|uniref:Uncharacterized protein n=1 Tax=Providencia stuartii (strain MRSN 2154) TaxID=1157951 RepID=A0A140NIU0_PROSM|nr:hypothetical protein S70_04560 [Providencia stuartii MRSN 2154]EKU0461934.1 hypothetical protein [Proteus mirabilis]
MSDKKEIATMHIKISVDSTDLDKLEGQLKRIEGLMVSTGLKQQAKQGFTADIGVFNPKGRLEPVFTVSPGVTYINEACIEKATLEKVMLQAVKEGAKKGAEQARAEITTGINDNCEQVSAEMLLKSSAEITETSKTISREQSAFEKFKQQVEFRFNEIQSQLTNIQCSSVTSEQSIAQHISGLKRQLIQLNKGLEEMRLKDSANTDSIISLRQAMEQQEKSMAEAIIKTVATDLCRGGTLSRML